MQSLLFSSVHSFLRQMQRFNRIDHPHPSIFSVFRMNRVNSVDLDMA